MIKTLLIAAASGCLAAAAGAARADEVYAGAFDHAPHLGIGAATEEHGVDLQLGVRSERVAALHLLGRPRVYAMLSKNLAGQTDFVSAGVLWRHNFTQRLYAQIGFGGALHDGPVSPEDLKGRTDRRALGSRFLFQEELSFGYHLNPRWAVEATYIHISNAHLWTRINPGMDDIGGRLVYRFGGAP